MRPRLLFAERDAALRVAPQVPRDELVHDLRLEPLLEVMAAHDREAYRVCEAVLLNSLQDPGEIRYRQQAVADAIDHPRTVRHLATLVTHAVAGERQVFHSTFRRHPVAMLQQVVETLQLFAGTFHELRRVADTEGAGFSSEAFGRFFAMVREELDDAFLAQIDAHLETLRFRRGMVVGAGLGVGNRLEGEILLRPPLESASWRGRLRSDGEGFTFEVDPQDEVGTRALARLRERGLGPVASALVHATDQILSFLSALRGELAFYVGCLNLVERLGARGAPICVPEAALEPGALHARQLRDLPLLLAGEAEVTANDVEADGRLLIVVTGANQGGKSTFLRSLGIAQLLFQAGMPVPAAAYRATPATAIFTHYPREEDASLERGRLDEELHRLGRVVDRALPGALLLSNESFASTNEREGSEIAWQVVTGLVDAGVRVVLVTHLFELGSRLFSERSGGSRFLRAPRASEAAAAYQLEEGPPLPTGFAEDRYQRIFR